MKNLVCIYDQQGRPINHTISTNRGYTRLICSEDLGIKWKDLWILGYRCRKYVKRRNT